MPIKIPDSLPATATLKSENIFVMTENRAEHQDIRPLKLLILNLMPTKVVTETQLLRKLSNTPLQIEVELLHTVTYESKNADPSHMSAFYINYGDIRDKYYDGFIITGAPVEHMEFEDVDYWPELCDIMEWSKTHVHSTLHICWGAQAALYYHFGIKKYPLEKKISGVYEHKLINPNCSLFRGYDEIFFAPHSRYTEVRAEEINACSELELLSVSDRAGVYMARSMDNRMFFVTGHPEYDKNTLALEYERDVAKGLEIDIPTNYFPEDDPAGEPLVRWRAHAQLMYTNWLNYYVYQTTPYDITNIGKNTGEFDYEDD